MKKFIIPVCVLPFIGLLYNIIANCKEAWLKAAEASDAVICGVSQLIICKSAIDMTQFTLIALGSLLYCYAGVFFSIWLYERNEKKRELQKQKEREACGNH